ncbi:hypothetical protein FSP39_020338 [Pinctada imbricata]|uniref:Uncharacterized protein n=1 Tax=Pinctada imbricata TaxID=66713 RepID=A0AA88XJR8_PINIB|nr:hypothetical protein FSP39_020338 [Pinctada imbricata]
MYSYCRVIVDDFWTFQTYREWSDQFRGQRLVNLDIRCKPGGAVFLPWPMKAKSLNVLTVEGCLIKGYFAEFMNETLYPDSMRILKMRNCVIQVDINQLIERSFLLDQVSRSYDCGQETLVMNVVTNITYLFHPMERVEFDLLSAAFDALVKHNHNSKYRCQYKNLRTLEQTISNTRSKLFFENLAESSEYPRLKFLNLSANSIPYTSKFLRNWSKYFPVLEELDLSHNDIENFEFLPSADSRTKPLLINLQFNKIRKVPDTILNELKGNSPVIVDLRNNPIDCRFCSSRLLKTYLQEVVTMDSSHGDLQDVKCNFPPSLKGTRVMELPKNQFCTL